MRRKCSQSGQVTSICDLHLTELSQSYTNDTHSYCVWKAFSLVADQQNWLSYLVNFNIT